MIQLLPRAGGLRDSLSMSSTQKLYLRAKPAPFLYNFFDKASLASASASAFRGTPFVSRNRKFSDLRAQTKLWLEPKT